MSCLLGGSPTAASTRRELDLELDPLRLEPSAESLHYLGAKKQWLRRVAECNRDATKVPTVGEFFYCPSHHRLLCAVLRKSNDNLLECGVCAPDDECVTQQKHAIERIDDPTEARQKWQQAHLCFLNLKKGGETKAKNFDKTEDKTVDAIEKRLELENSAQISERLAWLAYEWSVWDACVPLRAASRNSSGALRIDERSKRCMRLKVKDSTERGVDQLSERDRTWCAEHDCSGDAWPWRQLQNYDRDCGICYERPPSPVPQPHLDFDDRDLATLSSLMLKHARIDSAD